MVSSKVMIVKVIMILPMVSSMVSVIYRFYLGRLISSNQTLQCKYLYCVKANKSSTIVDLEEHIRIVLKRKE